MTVLLKQRDLPLVHTVARFWIPEVEHFSSPITFTQAKPGSLPVFDDSNFAEAFDGLSPFAFIEPRLHPILVHHI
jgi:hypothetical protein